MTIKNNKGIVLGILAITGLALMGILFSLSINTYLVQAASQELRVKTDIVCNALVGAKSFNHSVLSKIFLNQVSKFKSESIGGALKLKKAVLTIPTFPDDLSGGISNYSNDASGHGPTEYPLGMAGDVEVKIRLQVYNAPSNDLNYPEGLFKQFESAGNTYGCQLIGEVTQYSFTNNSNKMVSANSVTSNRLLGKFDINNAKGLFMAIAPHMISDGSDRFYSIGTEPTELGFYRKPNLITGHPNKDSYPNLDSFIPDELELGCSNPAILIRNLFSSAVLRLSSGTGELRGNTTLMLMNRVITNKFILNDPSNPLRQPYLIKNTAIDDLILNLEDLLGRGNYFSGPSGPVDMGDTLNVFDIEPVYNPAETSKSYKYYGNNPSASIAPGFERKPHPLKFMEATQLKNCLHKFRSGSVEPTLRELENLLDPNKFTSEGDNYFIKKNEADLLGFTPLTSSWSDLTENSTDLDKSYEARPEILAYNTPFLLGSIQRCPLTGPVKQNVAPFAPYKFGSEEYGPCPKPDFNTTGPLYELDTADPNSREEFHPDMVGLFNRLSDATDPYVTGRSTAPVLIITHQSLIKEQADAIRALLFSGIDPADRWKNRRVVVVLIPPYGVSGKTKKETQKDFHKFISPWINALGLDIKDEDAPTFRHRLFTLAPEAEGSKLETYDKNPYMDAIAPNEPDLIDSKQLYRNYWQDLLDPSSDNYVLKKAENIFMTSFFLTDRKL